MNYPPVIIIGMSRSGTSILVRSLEKLGLFIGSKTTSDNEAIFFQKLNKAILSVSEGGLDNPESIKYLLADKEIRKIVTDNLEFAMKTPQVLSFLGFKNYMRYRSPINLNIPWGWKDPRNTYTLPFWLDIFPEAKVIHICRHGVDVANSLQVRREKSLLKIQNRLAKHKSFYQFYMLEKFMKNPRKLVDLRCYSLETGIFLWEEYMREARASLLKLGDRKVEVKYEDFLSEPEVVLKQLVEFCKLHPTDQEIHQTISSLKKGRAYAYKDNPQLVEFADLVADSLQSQGY